MSYELPEGFYVDEDEEEDRIPLFDAGDVAEESTGSYGGTTDYGQSTPSSGYTTGVASTFGYNDPNDNGMGAWGTPTNNTSTMGVSLPIQYLRQFFGDENKAFGQMVEVFNPATGGKIIAPIVDKGPAQWLVNEKGPMIDLTHAANTALGGTGQTPMAWRILGDEAQQPVVEMPEDFQVAEPPPGTKLVEIPEEFSIAEEPKEKPKEKTSYFATREEELANQGRGPNYPKELAAEEEAIPPVPKPLSADELRKRAREGKPTEGFATPAITYDPSLAPGGRATLAPGQAPIPPGATPGVATKEMAAPQKEEELPNIFVEGRARFNRAWQSELAGIDAATSDMISDAVDKERNPYIDNPKKAQADIPRLEGELKAAQADVASLPEGTDPLFQPATDKLSDITRQLNQAQAALRGDFYESPLGKLSRQQEEVAKKAKETQEKAYEKWEPQISAARDTHWGMQLAESLGATLPSTAAAYLNLPFGLATMYAQNYSGAKDKYIAKAEARGETVDEDEARAYGHEVSMGVTPWELAGEVPLIKGIRGIFKMLPRNVVELGPKTLGEFIGRGVKKLLPGLAGETLVTTPGQSVTEDIIAEKHGVQEPTTAIEKAAKIPRQMGLAAAQVGVLGGGSLAAGSVSFKAAQAKARKAAAKAKAAQTFPPPPPQTYKDFSQIPPATPLPTAAEAEAELERAGVIKKPKPVTPLPTAAEAEAELKKAGVIKGEPEPAPAPAKPAKNLADLAEEGAALEEDLNRKLQRRALFEERDQLEKMIRAEQAFGFQGPEALANMKKRLAEVNEQLKAPAKPATGGAVKPGEFGKKGYTATTFPTPPAPTPEEAQYAPGAPRPAAPTEGVVTQPTSDEQLAKMRERFQREAEGERTTAARDRAVDRPPRSTLLKLAPGTEKILQDRYGLSPDDLYRVLEEQERTLTEGLAELGVPFEADATYDGAAAIKWDSAGNIRFKFNPITIASAAARMPSEQGKLYEKLTGGEELIHAADLISDRDEWIAGMKDADPLTYPNFVAFRQQKAANLWNDAENTLNRATPEERDALTRVLRDSYNTYFTPHDEPYENARDIFQALREHPDPYRTMDFVAEFLRQAKQLRDAGIVTEDVHKNLWQKLAAWVTKALARIRAALPRAYEGAYGQEVKKALERIEAKLQATRPGAKAVELTPREQQIVERELGVKTPPAPPAFYSRLQTTLQAKMPASATPQQVKGIINGAGLKPEEIKWTNVMAAIDAIAFENDGKVPKGELMDYLVTDGAVRLQVTTKGDYQEKIRDLSTREQNLKERANELGYGYYATDRELVNRNAPYESHFYKEEDLEKLSPEARDIFEKLVETGKEIASLEGRQTSNLYKRLTTEGGTNYQEKILTLPPEGGAYASMIELSQDEAGRWLAIAEGKLGRTISSYGKTSTEAYNDVVAKLKALGIRPRRKQFISSHYGDVMGYIAHSRTTDRYKAAEPGRLIEEIQSDLHQKGLEEGYDDEQWVVIREKGGNRRRVAANFATEEEAQHAADKMPVLPDTEYIVKKGEVPSMPFKADWQLQMFKRELHAAVEDGKEWIAWTTGKAQVERYEHEFRQSVDSIAWERGWETHTIEAQRRGNFVFKGSFDLETGMSKEAFHGERRHLSEIVGNDIAKQILSGTGHAEGVNQAIWRGEDLTIGGAGMQGFYDVILPKEIGKYVGKWGAQVTQESIPADRTDYQRTRIEFRIKRDHPIADEFGDWQFADFAYTPSGIQSALDYYKENYPNYEVRAVSDPMKTEKAWVVHFTPQMKEGVAQGQALFTKPVPVERETATRPVPPGGPVIKRIFQAPVVSGKSMAGKRFVSMRSPVGDYGRFFEGFSDIMEQTPGLEYLGRAVTHATDAERKHYGQQAERFRQWNKRYNWMRHPVVYSRALKDFRKYWQLADHDYAAGQRLYAGLQPASKELIDAWVDAADETGNINQARNVHVFNPITNSWRPIGKLPRGHYFPRVLRQDVLSVLQDPTSNPRLYDELVRELIAGGYATSAADADKYLSKVANTYVTNERFNNIEMARTNPLPSGFYDYSFETARRYIHAWANRIGQIEAVGQKVGPGGKDLFDLAIESTRDSYTQKYLARARDAFYNNTYETGFGRALASLNMVATGWQLGGTKVAGRNWVSAQAFNAQHYGVGRTLKSLVNLKRTFQEIEDGYERGIIQDDLFNMMTDADAWSPSVTEKGIRAMTKGLLSVSQELRAERWGRGTSIVAARSMLRDILNRWRKDPFSRSSRLYRGYLQRIKHSDPEGLMREGGSGPLTDEFLRKSVNEIQGGYGIDQTPVFANTPMGRFFVKYHKWGTQQLHHFRHEVLRPALRATSGGRLATETVKIRDPNTGVEREVKVPGSLMPLIRYLFVLGAIGAGWEEFDKMLWGSDAKTASWAEIMNKWGRDKKEAFWDAVEKMWTWHLNVGSLGILGNYAQTGLNFTDRKRWKNPLEPPGMDVPNKVAGLMMDLWEQGVITDMDFDRFLTSSNALYRSGKQHAAQLQRHVFGTKFPALLAESRRQDRAWLRSKTARFNEEIGVRQRTYFPTRTGKTEETPFRSALKEALMIGDTQEGARLIEEHFADMSPKDKKVLWSDLKQSISRSQPIYAGAAGGEPMRANFLKWAEENLSPADILRVEDIDQTYRDAAKELGLMKPKEPEPEDLEEAMERIKIRAGE